MAQLRRWRLFLNLFSKETCLEQIGLFIIFFYFPLSSSTICRKICLLFCFNRFFLRQNIICSKVLGILLLSKVSVQNFEIQPFFFSNLIESLRYSGLFYSQLSKKFILFCTVWQNPKTVGCFNMNFEIVEKTFM